MYENISKITGPKDVKTKSIAELEQLAAEARQAIIEKVSKKGGHLGPNLGMVETTIALHYVFDSPKDKFVWDVSHQAYTHKILTGRSEGFTDEAKYSSVSGFTDPEESEHDMFTVGHTSTSVALAAGLAKARDINGDKENIVAIIGDGSLSGGQAFAGLNNAGTFKSNFIIVVNDNEMSIAKNYGGLYENLQDLRDGNGKAETNFFTALGLDYLYVEEGHDIGKLIAAFESVKDIDHPIVVHIHTVKGNGYEPAIANKEAFHYSSPFDATTGKHYPKTSIDYRAIVNDYLLEKAKKDEKIMLVNAATPGAVGTVKFRETLPEQYFDPGIAEEFIPGFISGLAKQGIKPVALFGSTFMTRAYDQFLQDLCIDKNPALIIVSGGGISGADATHLGTFDIPMLAHIPNLLYLAPTTKQEVLAMLEWGLNYQDGPVALRIPSGPVIEGDAVTDFVPTKYDIVQSGKDVALFGLGGFLSLAKEVAAELTKSGINATIVNPKCISDLDIATLEALKENHQLVVTLEDGALAGGFGPKVASFYGKTDVKVLNLGADKEFSNYTPLPELLENYGLTIPQIVAAVLELVK